MNQSRISCKLRKAAILAALCGLQLTAAAQAYRSTVNDTWTVDSWSTATTGQVSVFPDAAYYDFTDIVVPETDGGAEVVATFRYSGGTHRQDTYGLEIIDAGGNIVGSEYHTGFTGGSHSNNVYTVSSVPAGTYTMRCWTGGRADGDSNNSTGTLTLSVDGTQAGSLTWSATSWTLDPSKVTAEGLIAVYGGLKVGTNHYKYMDKTIRVGTDASVEITYNYTADNNGRVDFIGVEAIDAAGNVVASDGHFGYSGDQSLDNVYTLNLTTSGTYTIRTWSNYVRAMTNTSGNIIYNIAASFGNHQPFTIANPQESDGGDGRGLLAYWAGNDVTDAPIAVEMKTAYSNYYRTGWPTSATADGVHTYWAKYISPNNNTYIYNVETGRFLSATPFSSGNNNHQGVSFSDIPMAIDINDVSGGCELVGPGGNDKPLCFAPHWGKQAGYYAIWYDDSDAKTNLCSLVEATGIEVSADVRAVVEKEVEIIENTGLYVGQYTSEGAAAAQALLSSDGGTRTAAVAETIRGTTISADVFYRIENAKNANIAIAQDQTSGKFIYANHTDGGNNFIFRFVPVGKETSSNWGGAAEYDTYRLYCVGAEKEGYVAWGTYNTQVSSANVADSKAYKVAEIGTAVFQISSAASNDNCTLSIGNGSTSVADNATGNLVSWNIYGNSDLTNTWRIWPIDAPEASTVVSVDVPAKGATACYFHHDAVIPEGYTVKTISASNAKPELAVNSFYNLTFDRIEGNVVPAGTAAVVENGNGTTGACSFLSTMAPGEYVAVSVASSSNILFGHHKDTPVSEGADNIYGLTVDGSGESTEHVFTPFSGSTHQAGQAYLSAAHLGNSFIATPAQGFNLVAHPTVAIDEIAADVKADSAPAYDLFGRRTVNPARGIYIIGGKKVLVK